MTDLPKKIYDAYVEFFRQHRDGWDEYSPIDAMTWLHNYYLEAAPEFDESLAKDAWRDRDHNGNEYVNEDAVNGARWQHDQLAAQIAALKAENRALSKRFISKTEWDAQDEQIAKLEANLTVARKEIESLKGAVEFHAKYAEKWKKSSARERQAVAVLDQGLVDVCEADDSHDSKTWDIANQALAKADAIRSGR